jgi:hypothetical protein
MKKLGFGFILLVFLFGCASIQVSGNLFVSKNPDVSVLVDPSFKYIGSDKDSWLGDSVTGTKIRYEEESFLFLKEKSREVIGHSIVILSLQKIQTSYTSDLFSNKKTYLENDIETLGYNEYQYITRIEFPSMSKYITRYLTNNGIILPTCIMVKRYSRAVYPNKLMAITYLEELPRGPYKCTDWANKEMLQEGQKIIIKAFSKRGNESFKVIADSAEITNISFPQKATKENWSEKAEKIKALRELLEKKLITQEEYDEKKKQLLEEF